MNVQNKLLKMPKADFFGERLANTWLKNQCAFEMFKNNNKRDLFIISAILAKFQKYHDFSLIFSPREVTKEEVQKLDADAINSSDYIALLPIVDLLSSDQVSEYINNPFNDNDRKGGLIYFHEGIGRDWKDKLTQAFDESIPENFIEDVAEFYNKSLKYDEQSFLKINATLRRELFSRECFNPGLINQKAANFCLLSKISFDFLCEINSIFSRTPELREMNFVTERFFPPYQLVPRMIAEYITWFNEQLKKCDDGLHNPIIFAGEALFRFASISPFKMYSPFTATTIVQLILRRYQLPPAYFRPNASEESVFFFQKGKNPSKVTVIQLIMNDLEITYDMIDDDGDSEPSSPRLQSQAPEVFQQPSSQMISGQQLCS